MSRVRFWFVEALLWTGAVLGAVSIVVSLLAVAGVVRPLVFTSGSMGPTIPEGSFALARPVPANDLRAGDIVNVQRSDGVQVTHRIVEVVPDQHEAVLTLKGDANGAADPETYRVTEAHRVEFHVPWFGRLVAFMSRYWWAWVGVMVVLAVVWSRGRPPSAGPAEGRHENVPIVDRPSRGMLRATIAMSTAVSLVGISLPAMAAFTDSATVTSGAVASGAARAPTAAATPCVADNPILGTKTVTVRWNGVDPTAVQPPASAYEYLITAIDRDTELPVGTTHVVDHGGAAGAVQSRQYSASLLGTLLGLDLVTLLAGQRLRIEIRSRLKATTWIGVPAVAVNFRVQPISSNFACT